MKQILDNGPVALRTRSQTLVMDEASKTLTASASTHEEEVVQWLIRAGAERYEENMQKFDELFAMIIEPYVSAQHRSNEMRKLTDYLKGVLNENEDWCLCDYQPN